MWARQRRVAGLLGLKARGVIVRVCACGEEGCHFNGLERDVVIAPGGCVLDDLSDEIGSGDEEVKLVVRCMLSAER